MIVDGHLDIAWNALGEGRGFDAPPAPGWLVSRSALVEAGVGLVFATLYCAPASARRFAGPYHYRTPAEAALMARSQVGYYRSVGLPLITTRSELAAYRTSWRRGRLAAVLLMEGADPIEDASHLGWWSRAGVRIVGLAWGRTRYSGGTSAPGGLTELGRQLLKAMARRRLILDLSHMADRAVAEALEVWRGPVIASHSNARALAPGDRQLPDAVLSQIGRRGGVVGVSFYRKHLGAEGRPSLEDVARQVVHLAAATGGAEHVGLGSDLDGGFEAADSPLDSLTQIRELRPQLRRHLSARQVDGVLGGNWLDFLSRSLPA